MIRPVGSSPMISITVWGFASHSAILRWSFSLIALANEILWSLRSASAQANAVGLICFILSDPRPDRAAGFDAFFFDADAVGAHGIRRGCEGGDEPCAGCGDEEQDPDRARALLVADDGAGYPACGCDCAHKDGG